MQGSCPRPAGAEAGSDRRDSGGDAFIRVSQRPHGQVVPGVGGTGSARTAGAGVTYRQFWFPAPVLYNGWSPWVSLSTPVQARV